MFDWTISLGNVLTIGFSIASIIAIIAAMRIQLRYLEARMELMEREIKKLVEILVQQGRQDERLTAVDGRLLAQGARIDDLTRQINRLFRPNEEQ